MDEMHVLGALFNGYLLEILISKILFLEKRIIDYAANNVTKQRIISTNSTELLQLPGPLFTPLRIQLIAMSATVGNVEELSRWFGDTVPFITDYRPVALFENIVAGIASFDRSGRMITEKLPLKAIPDYQDRKR